MEKEAYQNGWYESSHGEYVTISWHIFYIENNQGKCIEGELSELNIKRIKKEFKTHRSAIDFDEKFINFCFKSADIKVTDAAAFIRHSNDQQNTADK